MIYLNSAGPQRLSRLLIPPDVLRPDERAALRDGDGKHITFRETNREAAPRAHPEESPVKLNVVHANAIALRATTFHSLENSPTDTKGVTEFRLETVTASAYRL